MATQEAEYCFEASYVATTYTSIFGLPAFVSSFYFRADVVKAQDSYAVSVMQDGVVVGHMPKINCFVMITIHF